MAKKHVLVGLSGGLDSSACALLLKEEGYKVSGLFMDIWGARNDEIEGPLAEAKLAAKNLGIELFVVDLRDYFKETVIEYFNAEYLKGRTPNPCIVCNQHLKFGKLYEEAMSLGADYYATGHYVRLEQNIEGRWLLKTGLDTKKDQSYALYNLQEEQLPRLLFPLGKYKKNEIRSFMERQGFNFANTKESQEICFIPNDNHGCFIETLFPQQVKAGQIVSSEGEPLGFHKGLAYYTVGQRKGLNLAMGERYYVKEIKKETNELVVSPLAGLFAQGLTAYRVNWLYTSEMTEKRKATAKIRYNAPAVEVLLNPISLDVLDLTFKEPAFAVTPGQSVVFYDGDVLLGGGIIEKAIF